MTPNSTPGAKSSPQFKDPFAEEVWSTSHRASTDTCIEDSWARVAEALAAVEGEDTRQRVKTDFRGILDGFAFSPGGRISANAGSGWSGATLMNCYVGPREGHNLDSIEGIYRTLTEQALTLKSEGGYGNNFSFIRPRGSFIKGVGATSPGAVRFLELFDKSSDIITSGAGKSSKSEGKGKKKVRKGAQLAALFDWHPDIFEFIQSKHTEGRLDKFNISVAVTNEFADKVVAAKKLLERGMSREDVDKLVTWDLKFPDTDHPLYNKEWDGDIRHWEAIGGAVVVHEVVPTLKLWDAIMSSTYKRNDPGVLFVDRANETHCWNYGGRKARIEASNPCGEQLLPYGGVCCLGSLNFTQYVNADRTGFDLERVRKDVPKMVRFLDNVNTLTQTPLKAYKDMCEDARRIGLGTLGWGSALHLIKVRFASKEAARLKAEFMRVFTHAAVEASVDLAEEKGMFPACDPEKHAAHSFFKRIGVPKGILDKMRKVGIRNSALFSMQPTGNTGIVCNVVSGGIEPVFSPEYIRTSILPGVPDSIKDRTPRFWEGVYEETDLFKWTNEGTDKILRGVDADGTVYKIDKNRGLTRETLCRDYGCRALSELGEWDPKADWAVTAYGLTVEDHVKDMQEWAFWVDSAISKTVNVPNNYPYEKFENLYLDAYNSGVIKGITTYREGTMASVLKTSEPKDEEAAGKIKKNDAPKRPKSLEAEVHYLTRKGETFYVVVGLLQSDPYEIFVGKDMDGWLPKSVKTGKIVKVSRGVYKLVTQANEEYLITNGHSDDSADALCRLVSTSLRHGADIKFIVEQLEKTEGDMMSFAKVLARTLKKYIPDGTKVAGQTCPKCGSSNMVRQEGCKTCKDCGQSACG